MARTATVIAPAGLTMPTLKVYDAAGTQRDDIALLPVGSNLTRYQGPLTVTAGTYTFELLEGTDIIGAFNQVRVHGNDPEDLIVRDPVNDIEGIRTGQSYTRTNQAGDFLTETITEN